MGKKRRRLSSGQPGGFWRQEYGGAPMWFLVAAVVAILAFGAVGVSSMLSNPAPEARPQKPAPTFTYGTSSTPTPEQPLALFIGDSYSAGRGATSEADRWINIVASTKGWAIRNEALGGTGYITTADANGCGRDYCAAYGEVIDGLPADLNPAVVFIAGGQNDFQAWSSDSAAVTAAINDVYAKARAEFPNAQIVAVGPSVISGVGPIVTGLDQAVQAAAASVGATYISLINPDVLDPSMDIGDGGHVNDVGHRAIADAVIAGMA